jgi:hypothetical protein
MMILFASSISKIRFIESVTFQPKAIGFMGFFFLIIGILGLLTGGKISFTLQSAASNPITMVIALSLLGLIIITYVVVNTHQKHSSPTNVIYLRENAMLDPNTIPLLLKALDFLFGEGSKILEERRQRRMKEQGKEKKSSEIKKKGSSENTIQSKENALREKISVSTWKQSEKSVESLLETLEIYTERYQLARKQYAIAGEATVDYKVMYNLKEAEDGIEATMQELQNILSQVYNKQIVIKA